MMLNTITILWPSNFLEIPIYKNWFMEKGGICIALKKPRVIKAVHRVRGAWLARLPYATGASKGEALVFCDEQTEALRRPFILKQRQTLFSSSKGEGSEVSEHSFYPLKPKAQRVNIRLNGWTFQDSTWKALLMMITERIHRTTCCQEERGCSWKTLKSSPQWLRSPKNCLIP